MNYINNYGFKIINENNPIKKQSLSTLSVNYCLLPSSRMAKRVIGYNPINNNIQKNSNTLTSSQLQALNMYNANTKNVNYNVSLQLNTTNNYLQTKLNEIENPTNFTLNLLSVLDSSGESITLNTDDFGVTFNIINGYITIQNIVDNNFNYTNYTLYFMLTCNYNQFSFNYYLTYIP